MFEGNADGRPALRVPELRRNHEIVLAANLKRKRDRLLVALRVRVAAWRALAQRAADAVRSEGPHSVIVRDLCRTIYDQVGSKQPLTAGSLAIIDATLNKKINASASEIVEVYENVARASLFPGVVGIVGTIFKIIGSKAAGVLSDSHLEHWSHNGTHFVMSAREGAVH